MEGLDPRCEALWFLALQVSRTSRLSLFSTSCHSSLKSNVCWVRGGDSSLSLSSRRPSAFRPKPFAACESRFLVERMNA